MILDTLLLLFTADAKGVKSGADEAEHAQDKLHKKIKDTNISSEELGQSFLRMAREAVGFLAVVRSVSWLAGSLFKTAEYGAQLNDLSESLDVSVEDLDAWSSAVRHTGGNVGTFTSDVRQLSEAMQQVDVTGKSRVEPFFKRLGIDMLDAHGKARPVMDLLPQMASSFEKMAKQEAIGIGEKLGLSDATVMLLQKGRAELDATIKRQKELGVVTKEDAAISERYENSISDLSHVFTVLFSRIAEDVLPVLTKFVEKLENFGIWARDHKGFIYGTFSSLAMIMGVFAARALSAITVMGVPLYLVAAAVIAVSAAAGLLWDDFQKFKTGGHSLLGPMWTWLTKISDVLGLITVRIYELIGLFRRLGLGGAIGILSKIGFKGLDEVSGNPGLGSTFSAMYAADGTSPLAKANAAISFAGSTPLASQTSNSVISNSTAFKSRGTTVLIDNIDVHAPNATDSSGIAGGIANDLTRMIRQTTNNFDDGVKG